jgi:hypothetical protein
MTPWNNSRLDIRAELETKIFQESLDAAWDQTREFFAEYDPAQIERAETDLKHRMALVLRSYLGRSSAGPLPVICKDNGFSDLVRPAMGAFNEWAAGSFLADPDNRTFETVAMNMLFGACVGHPPGGRYPRRHPAVVPYRRLLAAAAGGDPEHVDETKTILI